MASALRASLQAVRERQAAAKPPIKRKPKPTLPKFRLPDKTRIEAIYSNEEGMWHIVLYSGDGRIIFKTEQPSLEYGTRKLGQKWLKVNKQLK